MLTARLFGTSLICSLVIGNSSWLCAEVKPHGLFTDNAVLQRGVKLPVWGTTDKTDAVKVSFAGQEVSAEPKEGKWRVELAQLEANSNPARLTISQGDTKLELKNILVGDVWICGGQSNMEWQLTAAERGKEAVAAAANDKLRLLTVLRHAAPQPKTDVTTNWWVTNPQSAELFSAVGYFFGNDLQKSLNVPIGLINANKGGTTAERWMSKESIDANADLTDMKPTQGVCDLWNGIIAPLTQFPVRGVIWYQGESNVDRSWQYRILLPAMIKCWRNAWGKADMPFLIVQIAPYLAITNEPTDSPWAELREAQLYTSQTVPNVGLAVITDLGDEKDIHPRRKREVGERLALIAKATVYGQNITYSGPIFDKFAIHADNAVLTFKHIGSGLTAKGGELQGFAVAGEDGKFHIAKAEIVGDTVIAWSDKVRRVRAVRYGWANYPLGNLWNKDGLPASPFRTDNYPVTTQDKK